MVSNADPTLDLFWAYGQRCCCEQLIRDQKSGIFQLESSGLRDPCKHRSATAGGSDSCAGLRSVGLYRKPGRRTPPRRSPLAAGPELCADRPAVAVTGCGTGQQKSTGLDTDPAARAGALYSQPWRKTPPETALDHAIELPPRPFLPQLLAVA